MDFTVHNSIVINAKFLMSADCTVVIQKNVFFLKRYLLNYLR